MRHIPPPDADSRDSRPLVAVLLGVVVIVGAFFVATAGNGTTAADGEPIAVTASASPAADVPADATVYRHDGFPLASPVHRAVKRGAETDGSASVTGSVEARSVVRLPDDSRRTTYYVRRQGGLDEPTAVFEVTVERR